MSKDLVESCFFPIVQSGGGYDIKVSALSNKDKLSYDIVLCSLGARYKNYCANISRPYMVDAPAKVENTYGILVGAFDAALEQMIVGNEIKDSYEAAVGYITKKDPALLPHFPKTLGFAIGLEFRDGSMLINANNSTKILPGMVLNLSLGFHKVPLSETDKAKAVPTIKRLNEFSLLLADTILIQKEGPPEVLTKSPKDYSSVSYNLSGKDDDDVAAGQQDEGGGGGEETQATDAEGERGRRSLRDRNDKAAAEQASVQRQIKQQELMRQRIEEARRRMESGDSGKDSDIQGGQVEELKAYRSVDE